jgi:sugar O-acyltransferase (sialic acid O-acetyltransferase NeuD family)
MFGRKKICIIGAGGSGRETLLIAKAICETENLVLSEQVVFMVKDDDHSDETVMGIQQIKESDFSSEKYRVVVSVGDSKLRKIIVSKLPKDTDYISLIHPKAEIASDAKIGVGAVIASGVIIMCNVTIGDHCQLNLYTTISHDSVIGDYFTTAMDVTISGNCTIKDGVYLGVGAKVKQGIEIDEDVIIGMGGIVVKPISVKGVYVGNPVKKIK